MRKLFGKYILEIFAGIIATVVGGIILAVILGQTSTPSPTPPPNSDPTNVATPTETASPFATPAATLSPIDLARTPVTQNSAWTPYERDYLGVTMVLVPAGCFMMGSINGDSDEQPIADICFNEPFWIDRTEVSRAAYQRCIDSGQCSAVPASDYSTGTNQPINRVTWFQARDFCISRGARLPTEAEWEYAARGPSSLQYPWGEVFVNDNAIFVGNANGRTAAVTSYPTGASWVGARHMSGNVAEWTNSQFFSYPYDANDGREAVTGNPLYALYVSRGGSFFTRAENLRTAHREGAIPSTATGFIGVRCARDFE